MTKVFLRSSNAAAGSSTAALEKKSFSSVYLLANQCKHKTEVSIGKGGPKFGGDSFWWCSSAVNISPEYSTNGRRSSSSSSSVYQHQQEASEARQGESMAGTATAIDSSGTYFAAASVAWSLILLSRDVGATACQEAT